MTTPSPTPEEIEAAARALYDIDREIKGIIKKWEYISFESRMAYEGQALAALKAAMAVRRGK